MKRSLSTLTLLWILLVSLGAQVPGTTKKMVRMPLFFEKAYLHTDRQQYHPGDDLWFKAYLVNGQNNWLTQNSSTLYVELISPQSEISSSETVRLEGGAGQGDFQLNSKLIPGKYRLRAYTNWMLNYGKQFVFEKEITLTEKQAKQARPAMEAVQIDLRFFPEGGNMVQGVPSVVAFKAVSSQGKSCNVTGAVVSDLGDTVVRFKSFHLGMGKFVFTPRAEHKYYAVCKILGNTLKTDFPTSSDKGFVLRIDDNDSESYSVTIASNEATLADDGGYDFLLIGNNHGKRFFKTQVALNDSAVVVSVPKNLFPEGISSLTLYDDKMQPRCERLIYREPHPMVKLTVTTSKAEFKTRDSVQLKLKLSEGQVPAKATLSVSVVNESSPASSNNISSYLWLQSELRGYIENASAYFDTTNADRFRQMELLLLTQGWRSFVWQQIADTSFVIRHIMEQGLNLSGKVREQILDKPFPQAIVSLTVLGANKNSFLTATTDSLGKFYFQGLDFYGKKKVTLVSKNKDGKNAGWILFDTIPSVRVPVDRVKLPDEFMNDTINETTTIEIGKDTHGKQSLSDTISLREVKIKSPRTVAQRQEDAGRLYGLTEYDRKLTDEDRAFGDLTALILDKVKYMSVVPPDTCSNPLNLLYIGPLPDPDAKYFRPLLVLNDKPLTYEIYRDSTNFHDDNGDCVDDGEEDRELALYQIPLKYIDRVMVFRKIANQSNGGSGVPVGYYVISVYTTSDYLSPTKEILYRQSIEVIGFYKARMFYAPLYDKEKGGRNDNRTTLYWEPNVQTNAQGEATLRFFNADTKGKVRIEVQGIGDKGQVISAVKTYEVK